MESPLCLVDDKHLPLYRILWVSDTPHFCGEEDCMCEGRYEVRLEADESLWANRDERDMLIAALNRWCGDVESGGLEGGEL
ncbi:hypothetical protein [Roseimaritima ulvae]|uniref:Uncharacterized protein n=1 Tax=Roseimaritima ulvae TaxID=980254 RepID=A0A5B9QXS3_9BACT|nr:hypothetical protein [Roseimaritima ulvae]QEG42679.1 hypothetical protein UC8_47210 [Roseimaritima ulvae]